METKKKGFDCVEFKAQAQRRLMEEFETRRHEFATYVDFLNAKAEEDPQSRALLVRFGVNRR